MATENFSIQILSDLHLENPAAYDRFEIIPSAPYLALLGDIGQANDERLFGFFRAQLPKFRTVFALLGNHEPYDSSWESTKTRFKDFQQTMDEEHGSGKFVFLDQTRIDLSAEVTILGCTLYSHVVPDEFDHVSFGLNDFHYIKDWTVDQHNTAHASDLSWLNQQVQEITAKDPQRKIVVLTHHSPTLDKRTRDQAHMNSKISSGFMSDLSNQQCWNSPIVKIWAYGHTHFNCDFLDEVTGKRLVSNQRGYYFSQAKTLDSNKVVTL